ncbi:Hypp2464 [Branchiostoma lanceolatum]|uniref:Hypp2464 protein n=1 Tax=Branchiostoma lanceolatum TaxID=7740 RepID=A0A8J9ZQY2_BRALA|nr:Hypp2464 [Branchiostoma lanceolatum]
MCTPQSHVKARDITFDFAEGSPCTTNLVSWGSDFSLKRLFPDICASKHPTGVPGTALLPATNQEKAEYPADRQHSCEKQGLDNTWVSLF